MNIILFDSLVSRNLLILMLGIQKISLKKFWKDLCNDKLESELIDFFIPQKNVQYIVAFSGGADSTLLLYIYHAFYKKNYITAPIAFHFNHKIRDDSDEDENFVLKVCLELDISLYVDSRPIKKIKEKWKGNLEEIARIFRYRSLLKLIENIIQKKTLILTGHQADDYLETVILRLLRGSTFQNVYFYPHRKIPVKFRNGVRILNIYSPLLLFDKQEIENFLRENHIPFREDVSNKDLTYKRNYIRYEIVQKLKNLNLNSSLLWQRMHLHHNLLKVKHYTLKENRAKDYIFLNIYLFENLSILNLKVFLDQITRILGISPFQKGVIKELIKQSTIDKIYIENQECIIERVKETIWFIKKTASLFLDPKILIIKDFEKKEQEIQIEWNYQRRIYKLDINFTLTYREIETDIRLKEKINDILRNYSLPRIIRDKIPYLKKENQVEIIYLSFLKEYPDIHIKK